MARKLIGFDPETEQAINLLSRDTGKSLQELANEAFADLLAKHHRPRTLKDALKQSSRAQPANENKNPPQKGTWFLMRRASLRSAPFLRSPMSRKLMKRS